MLSPELQSGLCLSRSSLPKDSTWSGTSQQPPDRDRHHQHTGLRPLLATQADGTVHGGPRSELGS